MKAHKEHARRCKRHTNNQSSNKFVGCSIADNNLGMWNDRECRMRRNVQNKRTGQLTGMAVFQTEITTLLCVNCARVPT